VYETEDDDTALAAPVGRIDTGLNPYQVHIVHATGTVRLDHCGAISAVVSNTLSLGPPLGKSVLSGGAAYLYRAHDLQLLLTRDELCRFIRRDLYPNEYLKLRRRFGDFAEIDDSFYTPATGAALQPVPMMLAMQG
jgi:hypothetical protein